MREFLQNISNRTPRPVAPTPTALFAQEKEQGLYPNGQRPVMCNLNSVIDSYRPAPKPRHAVYYPEGGKLRGTE
jgi:hypothetical protein